MFTVHNLPNHLPGEKIIKIIRKDLFVLFLKALLFALMVVLPSIFFYIFIGQYPDVLISQVAYPLIVLCVSMYYLFIWVFFFFSFIDYYLDIWIITSERVIDIEQRGFFSRVIAEHKLDKVQDVTSEVHGFFPTIMKYGSCHVQTAGIKERFVFEDIPDPEKVRNLIIGLVENKMHATGNMQHETNVK